MNRKTFLSCTLGSLLALCTLSPTLSFAQEQTESDFEQIKNITLDDVLANFTAATEQVANQRKIYGNPDARFILHEYSDVECPWCREYFSIPLEVSNLSNGEVAVEWHHMPSPFHDPKATAEALALECVYDQKGNRYFWVALTVLFSTTYGNGKGSPELLNLPQILNLDPKAYQACLANQKIQAPLKTAFQDGLDLGITGTPATFIEDRLTGEKKLLSGAHTFEEIMEILHDFKRNTQPSHKAKQE